MKIIGFSAGVVGHYSNTDRMVRAIMEKSGYDSEFVKLNDLNYSTCKGCAWLCAKPEVCKLEDDLVTYYQRVKDADAVVLGSPIYFGTISATMSAFISRLWGFRHVNFAIKNKPFVLVICGSGHRARARYTAEEDFREALSPFKVRILDVVKYSSRIVPCYRCGRHQECSIGGAYRIWSDKAHTLTITPELFSRWENDVEATTKVAAAAEKLREIVATSTQV